MGGSVEIIYTSEAFEFQPFGGVSRYFYELIRRMIAAGQPVRAVGGLHSNHYLRALPGVAGCYLPHVARTGWLRSALNGVLLDWVANQHPQAVLHQTFYSNRDYPQGRPLVLTVYDMIDELFPTKNAVPSCQAAILRKKERSCRRASRIIAISTATKSDLVRLYDLEPEKIQVIHLANSLPTPPGTEANSVSHRVAQLLKDEEPYLLYVGARGGYKNFVRILEAYAGSPSLPRELRLVCFGGGSFNAEEQRRFKELDVVGRVEQRGGDDYALAAHYRGARALVYPSLYEGFGLPLLEAMSQGCPVICARAGSIPEVAGDAAVYFDPADTADIRRTVEDTLADHALLLQLKARGALRETQFTWQRCFEETLALYQSL